MASRRNTGLELSLIDYNIIGTITEIEHKVASIGLCAARDFKARIINPRECNITFILECDNIPGGYLVEIFGYLDSVFKEWWIKVGDGIFIVSGIIGDE